jgi:hypothetical protein
MEKIVCFLIGCPLCLPGEDPGSERGDVAGRLRAVPRQDRGRDPAGRSRDQLTGEVTPLISLLARSSYQRNDEIT